MKTTKIISVALLFAMLSAMGVTATSASYGEMKGQGNSMTEEQREEMQNMTKEEREEYMEENERKMQDDDNDGISNREDDDYERDEDRNENYERNENRSENASNMAKEKANKNLALKAKYKNSYEEKYGSAISKMDNTQLDTFISKIDVISEKVETGDYSDETREKFNAMLDALREIAEDNLSEDDLLDGLFE